MLCEYSYSRKVWLKPVLLPLLKYRYFPGNRILLVHPVDVKKELLVSHAYRQAYIYVHTRDRKMQR